MNPELLSESDMGQLRCRHTLSARQLPVLLKPGPCWPGSQASPRTTAETVFGVSSTQTRRTSDWSAPCAPSKSKRTGVEIGVRQAALLPGACCSRRLRPTWPGGSLIFFLLRSENSQIAC